MGFAFCAADFDGNLHACSVFLEEGVDGFEQESFPPGNHVRCGGIGADVAFELEDFSVERVDTIEQDERAGDLILQIGDGGAGVREGEVGIHF